MSQDVPTVFTKGKRTHRLFTVECKAKAVHLVLEEGMSVSQVARGLDLTDSALRSWVKQAKIDAGKGDPGEPKLRWIPSSSHAVLLSTET